MAIRLSCALLCLSLFASAACSEDIQLVDERPDAGKRATSGPTSSKPVTRAEFCAGASLFAGACTDFSTNAFRYALCVCADAAFTNSLATDALDGSLSASVGVDGNLVSTGPLSIAGSLITSGSDPLPIVSSPFLVAGDMKTHADLTITSSDASFGRDLFVDGNVLAVGTGARVQGDLVQTPGHTSAGDLLVMGQTRVSDFSPTPPCACGANETLDVEALVKDALVHNDNTAAALARDALYSDGDSALELGCGRYLFDGGSWPSTHALVAHGRTALFIDGDLTLHGAFEPELGDAGELDLFVRGNLWLDAGARIGSPARPAALRIFVAGAGQIVLSTSSFAANLYAPHAALLSTTPQVVYGALLTAAEYATAALSIHYDRSVIDVQPGGIACEGTPEGGACSGDEDCESPSYCIAGACSVALQ